MNPTPVDRDRFRRQIAFAPIGETGQQKLAESKVAVVGVGALGSMIAERLTRMGVGHIRLIDRDWVELDNLHRQTLFTEQDAREQIPKSIAAARHLAAINSSVVLESSVADLVPENALELLGGVDLIADGTDNFETRFLINDVSLELQLPWVHGGCVGASGQIASFIPPESACLRCIVPDLPPSDQMATCDSVGVLPPAVTLIAGWQSLEAMKILSGNAQQIRSQMISFDFWRNEIRTTRIDPQRLSVGCPACRHGERQFLRGERRSTTQVLCGRNAVQIQPASAQTIDLETLANKLSKSGPVSQLPFLLRFEAAPYSITIFQDGRGIISGTEDPTQARKIFAQWIGN